MQYSIAHDTETGTRHSNQDRVAYRENGHGVLLIVADGLGGYPGGEMAAQTVVDCLVESFEKQGDSLIRDPAAFIVLSMTYAHTLINNRGRSRGVPEEDLPRTTCVACLVQNGYAYWAHVGDSRLYLFNDGELLARTIDHTNSDQMHQDGAIDEQVQRLGHSQLFRCVGGVKRPVVSLGPETHLGNGDTILLCSDGIWRAFKEQHLAQIASGEVVEDSVEQLFAHAKKYFHNECDNLTALMFRWDADPSMEKPLLNQRNSELDQAGLLAAKKAAGESTASAGRSRSRTRENIDSAIQEIESFVDSLNEVPGAAGGKHSGGRE